METNQPPSSFIPHEVAEISVRRAGKGGLIELFTLISIVLFVASGALGVGMFLYFQFLQANDASKIDQLERATAAFEPALIHELARLDDRMRSSSDILGQHIAPSALFRMLEQATIGSVSFRSLNFEAIDPQRMSIRMDGIADSVNAIALQADVFSKVGMVTSPIFSSIDRRADGVHFSLSAQLNPSTLNFSALARDFSGAASIPSAESETQMSPFGPVEDGGASTTDEGALKVLPEEKPAQ